MVTKTIDRTEKMKSLAVDVLCHCELDKSGRLYDSTGKAEKYLEYIKSLYFNHGDEHAPPQSTMDTQAIDDYKTKLFNMILKNWGGSCVLRDTNTLALMHNTRPELAAVTVDMCGGRMTVTVTCGMATVVFEAEDLETWKKDGRLIMRDRSSLLFLSPGD